MRSTGQSSMHGSVLDTSSGSATAWNLDALGNWTGGSQSRTFNAQNQITAITGTGLVTPTYDSNGNTTKDQTAKTYTFDAWNRMVKAVSGTVTETLGYLAGGQRASVTGCCPIVNTYSYYSSQWQDLEDDAQASVCPLTFNKSTYVWGDAYIDELVERDDASGNRLYAQQDANWNVTALLNTSGAVQERFIYDAYGNITVMTSGWVSTSDSKSWVYRYQGGRWDGVSGLYNFRLRDYSPTLGRWMENDPAGYINGGNLYQFELSDPPAELDPLGLAANPGVKKDRCKELDDEIVKFADKIRRHLDGYDVVKDGRGEYKSHTGEPGKPFGHKKEVEGFKRGLKNLLSEYFRKGCGDPKNPPPGVKDGLEQLNRAIPEPTPEQWKQINDPKKPSSGSGVNGLDVAAGAAVASGIASGGVAPAVSGGTAAPGVLARIGAAAARTGGAVLDGLDKAAGFLWILPKAFLDSADPNWDGHQDNANVY